MKQNARPINPALPDVPTETDRNYLDTATLRKALTTARHMLTNEQLNTVLCDSVTGARVTVIEWIDAAFDNDDEAQKQKGTK